MHIILGTGMDVEHIIECLINRLFIEFQIPVDLLNHAVIQQVMRDNNWVSYPNRVKNGWVPVKRSVKSR